MFSNIESAQGRKFQSMDYEKTRVVTQPSRKAIAVFPQKPPEKTQNDNSRFDENFDKNVDLIIKDVDEAYRSSLKATIKSLPNAVYSDLINEVNSIYVNARETREIGANGFYRVSDNTITLDPNYIDVQTTLTHELGHAVDFKKTDDCENRPYSYKEINDVYKEELALYKENGGDVISSDNLDAPYFTLSVGEIAAEIYKFENLSMKDNGDYKLICAHFPKTRELILKNIEDTRKLPQEMRKGTYCAAIEFTSYSDGSVKSEKKTYKDDDVFITNFDGAGNITSRNATYGAENKKESMYESYTNGMLTGQKIVYKNGDVYTAQGGLDGKFINETMVFGKADSKESVVQSYTNGTLTEVKTVYKNGDVCVATANEDGVKQQVLWTYGEKSTRKSCKETYDTNGKLSAMEIIYKTEEAYYMKYDKGEKVSETHVFSPKDEQDETNYPLEKTTIEYVDGKIITKELVYRGGDTRFVKYAKDGRTKEKEIQTLGTKEGTKTRVKTYSKGKLKTVQTTFPDDRVYTRNYNIETGKMTDTVMSFPKTDETEKIVTKYADGKINKREFFYKNKPVKEVSIE